jgi:hypothetical protein
MVRVATTFGTQRQVATNEVVDLDPHPDISVPLSLNCTVPAVLACAESRTPKPYCVDVAAPGSERVTTGLALATVIFTVTVELLAPVLSVAITVFE